MPVYLLVYTKLMLCLWHCTDLAAKKIHMLKVALATLVGVRAGTLGVVVTISALKQWKFHKLGSM